MQDHDQVGTADQRRTDRRALEGEVTMRIDPTALSGPGENISLAGLHFYIDQPIRVTVEVAVAAERKTYRGQLIRIQRIGETHFGLAVVFDAE